MELILECSPEWHFVSESSRKNVRCLACLLAGSLLTLPSSLIPRSRYEPKLNHGVATAGVQEAERDSQADEGIRLVLVNDFAAGGDAWHLIPPLVIPSSPKRSLKSQSPVKTSVIRWLIQIDHQPFQICFSLFILYNKKSSIVD